MGVPPKERVALPAGTTVRIPHTNLHDQRSGDRSVTSEKCILRGGGRSMIVPVRTTSPKSNRVGERQRQTNDLTCEPLVFRQIPLGHGLRDARENKVRYRL
jgi:hypothetical protein